MRLLNAHTLDLEEFVGEPGNGVPPYAILSHVWGPQEVTFHEMTSDRSALVQREGFQKILGCCAKAKSEGHRFVWIDTCCIDKSCSAELSEAINSMYRWYREATICYAYLHDVPSTENPVVKSSSFWHSRWFTRGWTLQELLAPYEVVFLSDDWREIGSKRSLSKIVSDITKVDERTLIDCTWNHTSVACRMSWASSRNTTRVEDSAYCLMGLFDINMPLIYGEGQKAFSRLQLEIMKSSDDQSIFAWAASDHRSKSSLGLLAASPKDFKYSYGIMACTMIGGDTISYDISKQYIRLSTPILKLCEKQEIDGVEQLQLNHHFMRSDIGRPDITTNFQFESEDDWDRIVVAILGCEDDLGYVAIPLRRLYSGEFERSAYGGLKWFRTRTNKRQPLQNVFVRALGVQNMDSIRLPSRSPGSPPNLLVKSLPIEESGYYISGSYPPNFISAPGDKPTLSMALSGINKATSIVTPIILFFAHEWPAGHQYFAIRFDRFGSYLNSEYHIRCRVGPSIKDWEKGEPPSSLQGHDQNVGIDEDAQVSLSEDKYLFVRRRKAVSRSHVLDFVNISIESLLPWQTQG